LLKRLRKKMVNESRKKLRGIVEADETIIGGSPKDKPKRGMALYKFLLLDYMEVISYLDDKERKG